MDNLYDVYHIPRESLCIFTPSLDVRVSDLIPSEDIIIVVKEQFKVGL